MLQLSPVILEGKYVRLEPLREHHAEGLWEAGKYEEIWTYMSKKMSSLTDIQDWIRIAMDNERKGTELPFVILKKESGEIIGSTRYMAISLHDKGLEIGHTWLTPSVWKTRVNTDCKYLLLKHSFEKGCIRVQLKTDARNQNSQRAIARIGGVREGVLRNHMIIQDGYVRDTVMYSILDREWPEVAKKLELLLFGES